MMSSACLDLIKSTTKLAHYNIIDIYIDMHLYVYIFI